MKNQNYVTVSGVYLPAAVFAYGAKGKGDELTTVEKSWSPLFDQEHQRILFVQTVGRLSDGEPREAAISGMLRPIDNNLRLSLASQHDSIEGIPVETRYMLVANERPGDATIYVLSLAVLFGILVLFAVSTAMRNTVFQATGRFPVRPTAVPAEPIQVAATGVFALDQAIETLRQRFINIPAALAYVDQGRAALYSHIDASSSFIGITTSKRAGIWTLPLEAGSVREFQIGLLYWGVSRTPALRFSYIDALDRERRHAIITSQKEDTLGAAMELLSRGAG